MPVLSRNVQRGAALHTRTERERERETDTHLSIQHTYDTGLVTLPTPHAWNTIHRQKGRKNIENKEKKTVCERIID
jgi:hypothetical protein